jgi:CubicO group peptidase (beta-lactamase class C family)
MRILLLAFATALLAAPPDQARIHSLAEAARQAWSVPGFGLAVVQGDQAIYLQAHGVKESGKPDPLTIHSTFQIASTTKAFTTTALAMLADEGKLHWDDSVRKHLDYFRLLDPHADALVTLRDLVSHRTGLPRHDTLWVRTGFTREDLIRRMAFAKPSAPFRSQYQYQNLMFTAAGEALGKTSGLGWDAFLKTRIFAPLGMDDTSTLYAEMMARTDRAMPHTKGKPGVWGNYDNIGGAGCIASSTHDMARWLTLQLNGGTFQGQRLVSAKNLAETHLPNMYNRLTATQADLQPDFTQTTYGLGWSINHYRGEMLVMHAGVLSGFRALVTMVPRLKLGFVVLANLNGTNLPEALTNTLLDEYLDLPKTRDWNAHMLAAVKRAEDKEAEDKRERLAARLLNTKPSLPLADYAGKYHEPAYGEASVTTKENKLVLEWGRQRRELEHWHLDTFMTNEQFVNFQFDSKGRPAKMIFLDQEFTRR